MSLVQHLDKKVQYKIEEEFQGFHFNENGLYISLDNDYPLMERKGAILVPIDGLYYELVEGVRSDAKSGADNEEDFMKNMVKLLNQEISSFFEERFELHKVVIENELKSHQKILSVYENRNMFDFMDDSSFKKNIQNKDDQIDDFIQKNFGKIPGGEDSERGEFLAKFNEVKDRYAEIRDAFNEFQSLMKVFIELTSKVKKSNAPDENKEVITKNLSLMKDISYEQMRNISSKNFSPDLQKKLFMEEMSVDQLALELS